MTDVILDIGVDNSAVDQGFKKTERVVSAALRDIERTISSQLRKAERAYLNLNKTTDQYTRQQKKAASSADDAGDSMASSAKTADSANDTYKELVKTIGALAQSFDTIADRAFEALGVVAQGVGAYLGASRGANKLARANENLIDKTIRLATAYVSLRQTYRGFVSLISTAAEFETQRSQLQGLFESVARGNAAFEWVRNFPVQAKGFEQALATLQGFGVDNLFQRLSALNNLVIKTGDETGKLESVARQLGQAYAQDALRAEELNVLIDRGIPIFALLSKALGVSAGQVRKLASEGKIGRTELGLLFNEIERSSAGAGERQLATFGGIITTLQREYRQFLALIADSGIFEFVKDQIRDLLTEIQRLKESGELKQIAINISDALVSISKGLSDIISRLLGSLKTLATEDTLPKFANIAGAALSKLAPIIGLVADNLDNIVIAITSFKAASSALGLLLQVAGWAALVVAIIKYRKTIFSVLKTVFDAAKGLTGLSGIIGTLAKSFTKTLRLAARFAGVLALPAAAAAFAISKITDAQQRLVDAERELAESNKRAQEFSQIYIELAQNGLKQYIKGLGDVRRAAEAGLISQEEALKLTRERFNELIELKNREKAAEIELARITDQIRKENAEKIRQANIELTQERIKNNKTELQSTLSKLKSIEQAEKATAKNIATIRQNLARVQLDTEDQIADIKRRGLSEEKQQASLIKESAQAQQKAVEALQKARLAESEEAKKAAIDEARRHLQRQQNLASQIQEEKAAIKAAQDVGNTRTVILEEELAIQEELAKKQKNQRLELQTSARELKQNIIDLQNELRELQREPVEIDLVSNAEKVADDLDGIKKRLKDLEKGVTIPIRRSGGGEVPGFARGGKVPGVGSGDTVPAMLEPGEFVIRRAAVRHYGMQLMQLINRMALPATPRPRPQLPRMLTMPQPVVQRFADGGPVRTVSRRKKDDFMTLEINLNRQPIGPVTGTRETISALVSGLNEIARAEL